MSYNKLKALQQNIAAIEMAWHLISHKDVPEPHEKDILEKYSGFGGIKEVLTYFEDIDKSYQIADDVENVRYGVTFSTDEGTKFFYENTRLSRLVYRIANADKSVYRNIIQSIKSSVLTAFYTPKEVVNAVGSALKHVLGVNSIKAESMLETSSGIGGFLPICSSSVKKIAFEKDIVSSLVLSALHPDVDVYNDGFENIKERVKDSSLEGHFDIVASNIPFGDIRVSDISFERIDDAHRKSLSKIHAYFFIKGLEQLENGGILAFVTSRGIADTDGNDYLRKWMVDNGHLLAAVRLPDNLFVDGSGIEVGSDLLVFQRDIHKSHATQQEEFFCDSIMKDFGGQTVGPVNRLLCQRKYALYTDFKIDHDRFGEKQIVKYYWRDGWDKLQVELTSRLSRDLERNFRHSAWLYGHDTLRKKFEQLTSNKAKKPKQSGKTKDVDLTEPYTQLMKIYNDLMQYERNYREANDELRQKLNEHYDAFVNHFGSLHDNEHNIEKLPDHRLMLGLEIRNDDKTYSKADVFRKPIAFAVIDENVRFEPMDALAQSLNELGAVDCDYIAELMKLGIHYNQSDVVDPLKGEIFISVSDNGKRLEWQHKSKVINGDVISKRKKLEEMVEQETDEQTKLWVKDTIEALRLATPTPIPYDDIDIQLGVRWLPTSYFEDFAKKIFVIKDNFPIEYVESVDSFNIKNGYAYGENGGKYGPYAAQCDGKSYSAVEVFSNALLDTCPTITKTIGWGSDAVKVTDHEAMRIYQKAIDKIRKEFIEYMHSTSISKEQREDIERIYNEKFNCFVRAGFDGTMQTFPGLDYSQLGFSDLYQSQKDAIWMLKQNNGGVCWHEVGAGKTMIMCVTAYEMHRLGIANKPLIIGLKANVHQIAETFRMAYPNGRLLYPGKEDFTEKNRVEFFNKIANNDWDCIIMTHDQFGRIPMNAEVERGILLDELNDIDDALSVMNHDKDSWGQFSSKIKKGLEQRKQNLTAKMDDLNKKRLLRSDDAVDFRTMGIDHIFVDEYQQYKNLQFTTRHGRVAGLGNSIGSQRSMHLLTAIRDIQQRKHSDMCATFLSGTIITNALTELYVLFKYLRPCELQRQRVRCFDAWAAIFTHKTSEVELSLTNEIKQKERFRNYVNVPELAQFLREITDFRTASMINLDVPKMVEIQDFAKPGPEQEALLDALMQFANNGDWNALGLMEYQQPKNCDKSIMLIATDIARKVALDPRMLGEHQFSDDPESKSSRCARRIADYYIEFNDHKGTQFVFSDLSTYNKDKWNIYSDIKNKLVNTYGIPANEIAFIQDYDTERKRKQLFDDLNDGKVRVVFGSTQKLGTGVNAQQRAVAVHHLDIPWRPSDLEQRNGRAVRKGNEVKYWGNNEVRVIVYGTERTLDAYKMGLLRAKQLFISSINEGIATRSIDEDSMTEDGGMNFAEYVAILSGNQDLLTKAKLDNKIMTLENDQQRWQRSVRQAEQMIETAKKDKVENEKSLADVCNELEHVESKLATDGGGLIVFGAEDQSEEEQGRKLFEIRKSEPQKVIEVGSYFGMPVVAWTDTVEQNSRVRFAVRTIDKRVRRCNQEGALGVSFSQAVKSFDNLRGEIIKARNYYQSTIDKCDNIIVSQSKVAAMTWEGGTELVKLMAERDELQERVNKSLAEKEEARQNALIENENNKH